MSGARDLRVVSKGGMSLRDKIKAMVETGAKASMLDVLITPEIATMLLRYNASGFGGTNRKMRRTEVAHWASIIRDGQWMNTGEPIILSDDKTLNDGQHRLAAVVLADQPALMDIRFGVPRAAFISTGIGRQRTGMDALEIQGLANQAVLAGALRVVVAYEKGLPGSLRVRVRPLELVAAAERYPDVVQAMTIPPAHKRARNASTIALAFFATRSANEATVNGFFDIIRGFDDAPSKTAAHQLRTAIFSGRGFDSDTNGRIRVLAVGIQCWNAYRLNETVKTWWTASEPFPKVDGLDLQAASASAGASIMEARP